MRTFALAALSACTLFGQAGNLASPGAGFVFDPAAQVLRRIQGIPGAALVGEPVDFGFPLAGANVSPRLDSSIVLTAEGAPRFFRLNGAAVQEVAIGSLTAPSRIIYSPSGSAAALLSAGSVQVLKGLPGSPALAATLPLHGSAKGLPTVAISDDGAYLLYSAGGPVELIGVAGDSRKLMDATPGSLVAFAPGGHDAAVVHGGTLYFIQDAAGASTVRKYPATASPTAIAFSPDAHRFYIASARGRSVLNVDVASGSGTSLPCDCAPAALVPMGSLLRLNELSSQPLWLLDTASDRGLLFVPARATN